MTASANDRTVQMKSTGRFTSRLRKLTHYSHDKCSKCGSQLPTNMAAFAGYQADGSEIYVGACCQVLLSELASHIYWWWESYKRPEPDTILWRYMDFAKFVAMLKDRALWFSRLDSLGDPFEGARGLLARESEWKEHCLEYFREAIRSVPGSPSGALLRDIEADAERLYRDMQFALRREVRETYASCWHANSGESEGLWRLYAPANSAGVAITTRFDRLDQGLGEQYEVNFGHVRYIDFNTRFAGTYDRVFWKRSSLSHEQEVRGVIKGGAKSEDIKGISVRLDLSCIDRVVISPYSPPWFEDVLRTTMKSFELTAPVSPSDILSQPFF